MTRSPISASAATVDATGRALVQLTRNSCLPQLILLVLQVSGGHVRGSDNTSKTAGMKSYQKLPRPRLHEAPQERPLVQASVWQVQ